MKRQNKSVRSAQSVYIRILIREFLFGKDRISGLWESNGAEFQILDWPTLAAPFFFWVNGIPIMDRYQVLLFDGYFFDLIITGLPEVPRLGADLFGSGMGVCAGGTFNMVRALHRLEMRVGWVCDFGNDLFSQFVLSEVRREGVDNSLFRYHDRPMRAFSLSFSHAGERGFISYIDPAQRAPRAPTILEHRPQCVFVNHLLYGPELLELAAAARQVGALLGMDCQSTGVSLATPGVVEALRSIDVFLPNASEALQLTGAACVEDAARLLAKHTPLVVIKLGPEGVLARTQDLETRSPALPVEVVETTGAGDCFNAGFLYGYLQGRSLESSLQTGCICGSLSTTDCGTIATPTKAQVEHLLQS